MCISLNAFGFKLQHNLMKAALGIFATVISIMAPVDNHTWSLNEEEEPKQLASA